MATAKVLSLSKNGPDMTIADGLAFIARTRRQLIRYDDAIPHPDGITISAEDRVRISGMCDRVEAEINELLGIR